MPHETMPEHPTAEIVLPAAGEYLSVVRSTAAALAANADFIIDDIEDLRIAVDEACSILVSRAIPGTDLACRFFVYDTSVTIEASAHVLDHRPPPPSGFAWMVLESLSTAVEAVVREPDLLVVTITRTGSKTKAG